MDPFLLIVVVTCLATAIAGIVLPITTRGGESRSARVGTDRQDPAALELGVAEAVRRSRSSRS